MKHTCGLDGDPGAVTPLDGKCAACDAGAQRVNDATAASEAYWRARELNHLATIELLEREIRALRLQLNIETEKAQ